VIFDEFGVDILDVDLAQIKTGVRVVAEPGKDRQDVRPILGVGERQEGFPDKPVAQLREALLRRSVKPFEALLRLFVSQSIARHPRRLEARLCLEPCCVRVADD